MNLNTKSGIAGFNFPAFEVEGEDVSGGTAGAALEDEEALELPEDAEGLAGGDGAAAADGAGGAGGGQPGEGAPETYTIKVGGVEKQVTLEELREYAQKGDDYTRKTQELAEQRKKLEQEYQDRLRRETDERVRALMEGQRRQKPGQELTPEQELTARLERLENERNQDRLDRTLKELADKHGADFNAEVFLAEAHKANADWGDMERLAEAHAARQKESREKAIEAAFSNPEHPLSKKYRDLWIKEYVESKRGGTKLPPAGGGATPGGKAAKPKAAGSLEDAEAAAIEALATRGAA